MGEARSHFKEGLRRRELNLGRILPYSVRKSRWIVTREIGHYPPRVSGALIEHKVIIEEFEVVNGNWKQGR